MNYYGGIDPGMSGGLAVLNADGKVIMLETFKEKTERDLWEIFRQIPEGTFLIIEKVNAMPKQGVASTFKFGCHFGCLIGLAAARELPYEFAAAAKWQRYMGCLSGGDKNITKAAAQRLFPKTKITHAVADALLIAEYCRRIKRNKTEG